MNIFEKINTKRLCRLAPLLAAAMMALTGCILPGEHQRTADEDFIPEMDYADEQVLMNNEVVNYTWFIQPRISAENIIVFDGSQINSDLDEINQMYRELAVICQNGLYGFIDYNGSIVIKPEYKYYFLDPGGQIVLYNIKDKKNNVREYCTMDDEGHIATSYDSHGSSRVKYYYDTENRKCYVTRESEDWSVKEYTDKKAVVAQKASVYESYGRMELVEPEEGQGGYGIVSDGEIVLDFEYDDYYAPPYKGGGTTAFALKKDDKWGYFTPKGEKLIDFRCDGIFSAYNGEMSDEIDSGHPFLYSEDFLAVSINSSFGYYNMDGKCLVRSSEFAQARPVHHKKAWVCVDGMWGIISFGEDDEEPITTTTTTTTTTTSAWSQWTSTSSKDDDEDEDDEDDFGEDEQDPEYPRYTESFADSPRFDDDDFDEPADSGFYIDDTEPEYTETQPPYNEPDETFTDPHGNDGNTNEPDVILTDPGTGGDEMPTIEY